MFGNPIPPSSCGPYIMLRAGFLLRFYFGRKFNFGRTAPNNIELNLSHSAFVTDNVESLNRTLGRICWTCAIIASSLLNVDPVISVVYCNNSCCSRFDAYAHSPYGEMCTPKVQKESWGSIRDTSVSVVSFPAIRFKVHPLFPLVTIVAHLSFHVYAIKNQKHFWRLRAPPVLNSSFSHSWVSAVSAVTTQLLLALPALMML